MALTIASLIASLGNSSFCSCVNSPFRIMAVFNFESRYLYASSRLVRKSLENSFVSMISICFVSEYKKQEITEFGRYFLTSLTKNNIPALFIFPFVSKFRFSKICAFDRCNCVSFLNFLKAGFEKSFSAKSRVCLYLRVCR